MRKIKIWLFLLPIAFLSCDNLDFYGDTFYAVKGVITDKNGQSIPNLNLTIYTSKTNYGFYPNGYFEETISGSGRTNENGTFLITFPKSNGNNFLVLEDGFKLVDSINSGASVANMTKLDIMKFRGYLLDVKTIRIDKP